MNEIQTKSLKIEEVEWLISEKGKYSEKERQNKRKKKEKEEE